MFIMENKGRSVLLLLCVCFLCFFLEGKISQVYTIEKLYMGVETWCDVGRTNVKGKGGRVRCSMARKEVVSRKKEEGRNVGDTNFFEKKPSGEGKFHIDH